MLTNSAVKRKRYLATSFPTGDYCEIRNAVLLYYTTLFETEIKRERYIYNDIETVIQIKMNLSAAPYPM